MRSFISASDHLMSKTAGAKLIGWLYAISRSQGVQVLSVHWETEMCLHVPNKLFSQVFTIRFFFVGSVIFTSSLNISLHPHYKRMIDIDFSYAFLIFAINIYFLLYSQLKKCATNVIFILLWKLFYDHQGCIWLITNAIKTVVLWNIITQIIVFYLYTLKCNSFLCWKN